MCVSMVSVCDIERERERERERARERERERGELTEKRKPTKTRSVQIISSFSEANLVPPASLIDSQNNSSPVYASNHYEPERTELLFSPLSGEGAV